MKLVRRDDLPERYDYAAAKREADRRLEEMYAERGKKEVLALALLLAGVAVGLTVFGLWSGAIRCW